MTNKTIEEQFQVLMSARGAVMEAVAEELRPILDRLVPIFEAWEELDADVGQD